MADTGRDSADALLDTAIAEMQTEGVLDDTGAVADSPPPTGLLDASTEATAPAAPSAPATEQAPAAPDAVASPAAETPAAGADDPLAGTTPFSYQSNGQARTVEGIYVAPEGGIIPAAQLPALAARLEAADRATAEGEQWRTHAQTLATQLDGLTAKVGDQEFRGPAAFRALEADRAATIEGSTRVIGSLADKEFVYALAVAYSNNDEATARALLNQVVEKAGFAYERAQFKGLRDIDQTARQAQVETSTAQADEQGFDGKIDEFMRHPSFASLTPEDRQAARVHFAPFRGTLIRTATAQDVAASGGVVQLGQRVIDGTMMQSWFTDRAALRQAQAKDREAAKTAQTAAAKAAEKAGQFNAGQQRGRQGQKPAAKPASSEKEKAPEKVSRIKAWDDPLQEAMAEMGVTL